MEDRMKRIIQDEEEKEMGWGDSNSVKGPE